MSPMAMVRGFVIPVSLLRQFQSDDAFDRRDVDSSFHHTGRVFEDNKIGADFEYLAPDRRILHHRVFVLASNFFDRDNGTFLQGR